MSRDISENELFDLLLEKRLRSVHTSLPATIRAYSEATQTATCELAVELEGPGGEFLRVPNLEGVPVTQPGAWTSGDRCLLVFCEESFAKWFETGSVEPPDVLQRHGMHAICIPLVARAGDAVQFVALANLVSATLNDLVTRIGAWKTAVAGLPPTAPVTNGTMASAIIAALETALTGWPAAVAAAKVKAR